MPESRRQLLAIFMGAVSAMAAEPLFGALAPQARSTPQARPYPNGRDPNVPPDAEHRVLDPKAIELQNQKELRSDVAKLYEMVSDLKQQLEKTDPATTLSISLVKKTEQIEKLAKQIKSLARG
jgi:phytoene dehydrogenase-like protein